jgi:heptosyltransferase-2
MDEYFEWINSCRVLVTNDSFGMHIAMALKKKFIAIFGPTHCQENHLYGLGVAFSPKDLECDLFPCRENTCRLFGQGCTTVTTPDKVRKELEKLLSVRQPVLRKNKIGLGKVRS